MKRLQILDVGQCGFDGPRMAQLFREQLHAHVDSADTLGEAVEQVAAHDYDLVLVNRILNADGSSGLDVIRALLAGDDTLPVMLVSDRKDAQAAAEKLGALPGFGKAQLEDPATLEHLARYARHEA